MPDRLAKSTLPARPVHERAIAPSAGELLAWYRRHARILPWRVGPREREHGVRPDPYRVWLSEIMLQQTTVKAVGPYFRRFVERWPTVAALAAADEAAVMAAWAGLGYYSRARNLLACARAIVEHHGGAFPNTAAALAELPGIGAYTSAAIAAIAFDEPIAVVDGNVERVIARLFAIDASPPALKGAVRETLQPLVPGEHAGAFAEALMDLGATICTPRKPACALCPWSAPCQARRQGRPEVFPVKAPRRKRPLRHGVAFVARRADGAILLRRRPPRGLLGGMSEVPGSDWREDGADAVSPVEADWTTLAAPVAHGFTHFELRLVVRRADVACDAETPPSHWWAQAGSLSEQALPSLMKKVIEAAFPGATKPARDTGKDIMTDIRHIVFDVGNVLIRWERDRPYRKLIPDAEERKRFLDEVCSMEWHLTLDDGVGIDEAIAGLVARFPHQAELIGAYKSRWLDTIPGAIEGTVEILEELVAQGRDVTALTNFNQDLFKTTVSAYPFLALFRGVTVSGEARMTKPDPAIYAHHAEAFGLTPGATLFFDDAPKNIEAARAAGWNAEIFTSPKQMREDLGRYGIS